MKTAFFVLISAGALLGLAGCFHAQPATDSSGGTADGKTGQSEKGTGGALVAADRTIDVAFDPGPPTGSDPNSDWSAHWKLTEPGKGGALHHFKVETGKSVQWQTSGPRPAPFSIVVTNQGEWKVVYAAQSSWRLDACCPYTGGDIGVIDSKPSGGQNVITLSVNSTSAKEVGYVITVPPVPSIFGARTLRFSAVASNDLSLVDATMDWNSSLPGKGQ